MNRQDRLNRLDFNYYRVLDEQIDSITDFDDYAVIIDRERSFHFVRDSESSQLVAQADPVHAFQQPGTELRMDLVG